MGSPPLSRSPERGAEQEARCGAEEGRSGPGSPRAALWTLCGGLLLALASPPGVFPYAGLLSLPGLVLLFRGVQERVSLWALYGAGVLFFGWLGWSLRFVSFGGYLAIPLLGGLYFVLLGLAWRGFRGAWGNPLLLGLLWMGLEYLRGHMPGIPYPLGQVVHSVAGLGLFRAPARWIGEAGLGGLYGLLAASILALFGRRGQGRIRAGDLSLRWGMGGLLGVLVVFGASWGLLSGVGTAPRGRIQVALCQVPTPVYPDQEGYDARRGVQARIREFAAFVERHREEWKGSALLVFPESAFPFTLSSGRATRLAEDLIARLRPGAPLLIGAGRQGEPVFPGQKFPPRFNSALLFTPGGRLLGQVDKRWLVPLGETLPGLNLLSPESRDAVLGVLEGWVGPFLPSLSPGEGTGLLQLGEPGGKVPKAFSDPLRLAVGICFENAFPEAFLVPGAPADLLVVLSNEAWYRGGATLDQMLALSRLRAVEAGRPLLRSTVDGWTTWFRASGAMGAKLPPGKEGVLLAQVPLGGDAAPGLAWGPWFGRFGLGLLVLGWIAFVCGRKPGEGGVSS